MKHFLMWTVLLQIYPSYNEAITAKAGIVSGLYQHDGKRMFSLDTFRYSSYKHVDFIDQYINISNKKYAQSAERDLLAKFYHQTGYQIFAEKNNDFTLALKYLNWGKTIAL